MSVKTYRTMLIIMLIIALIFGGFYYRNIIKKSESTLVMEEIENDYLIPGGMPVGIYLETDGVMVVGTEKIKCESGIYMEPAKNLVKNGDYIVGINEEKVEDKNEVLEVLSNLSKKNVILHLRRNEEYIDVSVSTVTDEGGKEKLGIWIKDDAQGLGTVTFLTANSEFGALGHGIIDTSTNQVIEITEGTLYETSIQNIVKGKDGFPGGMEGIIVYNKYNVIGTISQNTAEGIYGKIDKIDRIFESQKAYPAASKEEIEIGKAAIRCTVDGKIDDYEIMIKKVNFDMREKNKGIEIQVTDEELLKLTGGIVQGMSGSPILQNGKIVGAVTHVFVQDSTRGYGIFIENMLKNVS